MRAFKTLLVTVLVVEAMAAAVTALHPSVRVYDNKTAPAPFNSFMAWAVMSQTEITANGTSILEWSAGMYVEADWQNKILCQYSIQELFPTQPPQRLDIVYNYTSHVLKSHIHHRTGLTSNCTREQLDGQMQPGGAWFLAPDPALLLKLQFIGYYIVDKTNTSLWQYTHTDLANYTHLFQWYYSVDAPRAPLLYINKTTDGRTGEAEVMTTAYRGYQQINPGALNEACYSPFLCGAKKCVANMGAGDDAVGTAMGWACGQGDYCTNISDPTAPNWYPNTLLAHATIAFNGYYQANAAAGAGSCYFNGAAMLVDCSDDCTKCNATQSATESQLKAALEWVCGPQGIQDCSPIQPNGKHFFPNTTRAHADWAFNVYYQAYRCIPNTDACDFNGTAAEVPCS